MASATALVLTDRFAGEYAKLGEGERGAFLNSSVAKALEQVATMTKAHATMLHRNIGHLIESMDSDGQATVRAIIHALERTLKLDAFQRECLRLMEEDGDITTYEQLVGCFQVASILNRQDLLDIANVEAEGFARGEMSGGDSAKVQELIQELHRYPLLFTSEMCLDVLKSMKERLGLETTYPLQQSPTGLGDVRTYLGWGYPLPFTSITLEEANDGDLLTLENAPCLVQLRINSGTIGVEGLSALSKLTQLKQLVCPPAMFLTGEMVEAIISCKPLDILYLMDGTRITRSQRDRLVTKVNVLIHRDPIEEDAVPRRRAGTVSAAGAPPPPAVTRRRAMTTVKA